MRNLVILFVTLAFSGSALAAHLGLPVKARARTPAWSWSGFYVGGNLGAGLPSSSPFVMTDPANTLFAPGQTEMVQSDHGNAALMGGLHMGYNYQFSRDWVVGAETDLSFTGLNLQANAPMDFLGAYTSAGTNLSSSTHVRFMGTIRGRFGYAGIKNWLFYGTGGWAYADVRDAASWTCSAPSCGTTYTASGSANRITSGWAAGGGVEYHLPAAGFGGSWIIGAEYLYYAFDGTESAVAYQTPDPRPFPMTWGGFNVQEARVRLSDKF